MKRILFVIMFIFAGVNVHAVEGCKYLRKIEIDQQVYCKDLNIGGEWYASCSTSSTNHCDPGQSASSCYDWTGWVAKERGDKCTTLDATVNIGAMLTASGPSWSMQQWLEAVWNAPPGYTGGGFTPYDYNQVGKKFCSPSYVLQSWTTYVGMFPYQHQVKVHYGALSGEDCDKDVHVVPQ